MATEQHPSQGDEGEKSRVEVINVEPEPESGGAEGVGGADGRGDQDRSNGLAEVDGADEKTKAVKTSDETGEKTSGETESTKGAEGTEHVEGKDEPLTITIDDGSEGDTEAEDDESEVDGDENTGTIRYFRKRFKKQQRQIAELRERLGKAGVGAEPPPLEKPPLLADCDYDEEEHRRRSEKWLEQKLQHSLREETKKRELEKNAADWQRKLAQYNTGKEMLGARDYSDAEETVKSTLGDVKFTQILEGAAHPEDVIYALAQHPDVLEKLADLQSNNTFAWRAAELQGRIVKVKPKKPAAPPERIPKATAQATGMTQSKEELLRKKAHETGEFSELHEFQRQQRRAAAERR